MLNERQGQLSESEGVVVSLVCVIVLMAVFIAILLHEQTESTKENQQTAQEMAEAVSVLTSPHSSPKSFEKLKDFSKSNWERNQMVLLTGRVDLSTFEDRKSVV